MLARYNIGMNRERERGGGAKRERERGGGKEGERDRRERGKEGEKKG